MYGKWTAATSKKKKKLLGPKSIIYKLIATRRE
jgi:hypothetical protein